jgi:hypothetical protein
MRVRGNATEEEEEEEEDEPTRQSARRPFSFRAGRTRETASGFPNTCSPICSRIASPTDSYVAVLHKPIRIWELRVESTAIREQLTRCLTDQSVLFVVEPVPVSFVVQFQRLRRGGGGGGGTMTTGSDIAVRDRLPVPPENRRPSIKDRRPVSRDSCHGANESQRGPLRGARS